MFFTMSVFCFFVVFNTCGLFDTSVIVEVVVAVHDKIRAFE